MLRLPKRDEQDIIDTTETTLMLAKLNLPKADKVNRECLDLSRESSLESISFEYAKYNYVKQTKGMSDADWFKAFAALKVVSVALVDAPRLGRLTVTGDDPSGNNSYKYIPPSKDFRGDDRFSFLVKLSNGKSVLMRYDVVPSVTEKSTGDICNYANPRFRYGQVQMTTDDLIAANSDYPAWLRSAQLSALLSSAQSAVTSYQDLPATSLGQTIAQGASASITLDTNAAGHGWYVDPTPLDATDEYLPTSSPNIWQAKANSAAAGKIDLLSVLLHEYGHALGLSHSSDASDFMAAKLQPAYSRFVRRLPSAAELQTMSEIVAQIKETSPQPSPESRGSTWHSSKSPNPA